MRWKGKVIIGEGGSTTEGDNFLKQIALGAGAGIRLDFTYFILLFDMALKLKNNFKTNGSYWVNRDWGELNPGSFNYNLAVGYPF